MRVLWHNGLVLEIALIVVALVVVIPVGFLMSTAVAAAAFGFLLKRTGDSADPTGELIKHS